MRNRRRQSKIRKDTSYKKRGVEKKKKASKRIKMPKVRNAGTFTEQMFWNWIRSTLRRKSMFWKPIANVRNKAKVPYNGPNKRRKFSFICSSCNKAFSAKEVAVHHLIECGSLTCAADLPGFVERLFCEEEGLTLLCNKCHNKIHE